MSTALSTLEDGIHKVAIYEYRAGGKQYFQVVWRQNGIRRKTSYARLEDAEGRAQNILELLRKGVGVLADVNPTKLLAFETYRRQLGDRGIAEALHQYASRLAKPQGPFVADVVRDFLSAQKAKGCSTRHIQTLRHHLNKFGAAMHKRLSEVGVEEIDAYLGSLKLSAKSVVNHRISITSLFGFGKRKGWIPADRKTAAELTEKPKAVREDPEVFTPEEMQRLLQHAGPETKAYLAIAAFAGIRAAELSRMTWDCWNREAGCLSLASKITKTSRRRNVEVSENLGKWLHELSENKQPDERIVPVYNLHRFLRTVAKNAGVAWKQNGLRHSYASYHLELFSDAARTSKNCGHSIRELETTYLRLTTKQQAEQWFAIEPQPKPEHG